MQSNVFIEVAESLAVLKVDVMTPGRDDSYTGTVAKGYTWPLREPAFRSPEDNCVVTGGNAPP